MPDSHSERKGFWGHPLTILLIGTVLSVVLVPHFSEQIDHKRLINETRLKKATEILADNADTARNLNRLSTTLGIFQKDSRGPAARFLSLEKAQKELRTLMVDRYLEFDRQAWWWPGQIHVEAKILEIASQQELDRLEQIGSQYNDNLVASVTAIDILWSTFLREKYNPVDPRNEELLNQTQAKLIQLNQERSKLCMEAAQILAKKQEGWMSRWTFGLL
jgi:hypothetical protein